MDVLKELIKNYYVEYQNFPKNYLMKESKNNTEFLYKQTA
jgi:hypothetical protein